MTSVYTVLILILIALPNRVQIKLRKVSLNFIIKFTLIEEKRYNIEFSITVDIRHVLELQIIRVYFLF